MYKNISVFESYNIIDALNMVKNALGPDAIILDTKKVKPFWFFGKEKIRITAAVKNNSNEILNDIIKQISELKKSMEELKFRTEYADFLKRGADVEFVDEIIRIKKGLEDVNSYFDSKFKVAVIDYSKPLFFTGIASSGKTRAVCSMALKLKSENKKVAIISIEQEKREYNPLKELCLKNNFSFFCVKTVKDLLSKVKKLDDSIVLIDTFPLNSNSHDERIEKFSKSLPLNILFCHEISKGSIISAVLNKNDFLLKSLLVLTKFDEVNDMICFFNSYRKSGLGLALVTGIKPYGVMRANLKELKKKFISEIFERIKTSQNYLDITA